MNKTSYRLDSSLFFRFQNAVEILTIGKGDSRSRLQDAFHQIESIRAQDLPEKFRKDLDKYRESITRFKPRGKDFCESEDMGSLAATMKRIKNKTASKMAKMIFDILCTKRPINFSSSSSKTPPSIQACFCQSGTRPCSRRRRGYF